MTKNTFNGNSIISPISLSVTQNGNQFDLDNLNLNMIIKYQDEWYCLNMKEKSMNDYYAIYREQLKTLKEHMSDYYSFLATIKDTTTTPGIVIKQENYENESSKLKILSEILNNIEEEKKILNNLGNFEEINHHYNKIKEIIFKIKIENEENPIPANSHSNIEVINDLRNKNKNRGVPENLGYTNTYHHGDNSYPVQNRNENQNMISSLSQIYATPIKTDVKVLIEEEPQDVNIFSYISEDVILSNLDNFDSNVDQIDSIQNSKYINSFISLPNSAINSEGKLFSNNSFLGKKRPNSYKLTSIIESEEITKFDCGDVKYKKLKDDTINSLFSIGNHKLKLKRYTQNCIDCGVSLKIIKIDKICCDNYLCKTCVMKNFTFLSELIVNFNVEKYKIDKCLSVQFKVFFCNYCYLIDNRENLEECGCSLCYNLFHRDCYIMMKIVDRNSLNLDKNEKTRICEEVVSMIIEEENTKKFNIIDKKIKNANLKFLQSCYDSGQLLMILYKFNRCSFYKFYINYFIQYMLKKKDVFNRNFTYSKYEMVCQKHLCMSCLQPIDELNDCNGEEAFSKICCNNLHKECYGNENSHLDYIYNRNTSHLPILHFKFIREFYSFVKRISMYNNSIYYNKDNFDIKQGCDLRISNENINLRRDLIQPYISQSDLNRKNTLVISQKSDYTTLSEKEKEDVMKSFNEIHSNRFSKNINKEKKNKTLKKGITKCECLTEIIKHYKNSIISMTGTDKRKTNLRSSLTSAEKNLKDENLKEFIKNYGYCCSESCNNRILKVECFKNTCDCPAEYCLNRYDKPNYYNNFEIIRTSNRGYGLICNKDIKKGEFIIEYIGDVIDYSALIEKSSNQSKTEPHSSWYAMSIDNNLFIDASVNGNKARFINHSCNPNAFLEKWLGEGFNNKIFLFASRDIPAGFEISYNYNFDYFSLDFKQECKCGESSCRGIMGGSEPKTLNNLQNATNIPSKDLVQKSNHNKKNKSNPLSKIAPKELKINPLVILDKDLNVILDMKILKECGFHLENFKNLKMKPATTNEFKNSSYTEKIIKSVYRQLFLTNSLPTYKGSKKINKLPFLKKNADSVIRLLKKKFILRDNNQLSNELSISQIFSERILTNTNINSFPCYICNMSHETDDIIKHCESCKCFYHLQCLRQSILNKKENSSCQECLNLLKFYLRKKIHIPKTTINEEFLQRLKALNLSNMSRWEIVKNQLLHSKMNEKISYSLLLLRNESRNRNSAYFYEYEIFFKQFKSKAKGMKTRKKFRMLTEIGDLSIFASKAIDLFKGLIKEIDKEISKYMLHKLN